MSTVTLYHGTPKSAYEEIIADGFLIGPVYLTPNKNTAEEYAANNSPDYVVFEVEIEYSELNIDREFVSEHSIEASLEAGSVFVNGNVGIEGAIITIFENYCEV